MASPCEPPEEAAWAMAGIVALALALAPTTLMTMGIGHGHGLGCCMAMAGAKVAAKTDQTKPQKTQRKSIRLNKTQKS